MANVDANATEAPDGTVTAEKLVANAALAEHSISQQQSWTASTSYAFSVFAKAAEYDGIEIRFPGMAFTGSPNAKFNLTNATTIAPIHSGINSIGIEPAGNGWYFCWAVATSNSSPASSAVQILPLRDGQSTFEGNNLNGIYAWQAQLETAAFTSSVIAESSRASDQFFWPSSAAPASSALRNRFAMQFIPEYSSDNAPSAVLAYFSSFPAVRIELQNQIISVRSDSSVFVQTNTLTWSRGDVLTLVVDSAAGQITTSGFQTGNGTYPESSAQSWSVSSGDIYWGMRDSGLPLFALLSEPYHPPCDAAHPCPDGQTCVLSNFGHPICTPEGQAEDCDDDIDNDDDGDIDCADSSCIGVPECPEICDDNIDNEGDGRTDCYDSDCFGRNCPEICGDGEDNDANGREDCADRACMAIEGTCPENTNDLCSDDLDNDGDSDTDCYDSNCRALAVCQEDCDDGEDNDKDGLTDCYDYEDCQGQDLCIEDCDDRMDNDRDGLTDCADKVDCEVYPSCLEAPDNCDDNVDNDVDKLFDCDDPDCMSSTGTCPENTRLLCQDGFDNDGDGFTDCDEHESDCLVNGTGCLPETCEPPGTANPIDEDGDGETDCMDDACWIAGGVCPEVCTDLHDNDGDGLTDCYDSYCADEPQCCRTSSNCRLGQKCCLPGQEPCQAPPEGAFGLCESATADAYATLWTGEYSNPTTDSPRYILHDGEMSGPFAADELAVKVIDGRLFTQIEGERQNLFQYSEDFNSSVWTKTNLSVTVDATIAPDGQNSADLLRESSDQLSSYYTGQFISVDGYSWYTLSVFAKPGGRSKLSLTLVPWAFTGTYRSFFDLENGSVISGPGIIEPAPNGFYRVSFSALSWASGPALFVIDILGNNGEPDHFGDDTKGMYLWGAQTEKGAWSSSYIKTESSPVTRSADLFHWPASTVPAAIRGPIAVDFIPQYSQATISDSESEANPSLIEFGNSADRIRYELFGRSRVSVRRANGGSDFVSSENLNFSRGQKLTFVLNPDNGRVTVKGASAGNGTSTGTSWTLATGDLYLGSGFENDHHVFGLISEPYIPEICDDAGAVDEDGDGRANCADEECMLFGAGCVENDAELCLDELDNDGDGDTDCRDSDCILITGLCGEVCYDGIDNDNDGIIDCADEDCMVATSGCVEICDDGIYDNDGDGLYDCDDGDCRNESQCRAVLTETPLIYFSNGYFLNPSERYLSYLWDEGIHKYIGVFGAGELAVTDYEGRLYGQFEGSRTNILLNNLDHNAYSWSVVGGATILPDDGPDPYNTTTVEDESDAVLFVGDGTRSGYRQSGIFLEADRSYTFSTNSIKRSDSPSVNWSIEVERGEEPVVSASDSSISMWQKNYLTFDQESDYEDSAINIINQTTGGETAAYYWGEQLEEGRFASSTIITGDSPATRMSDEFWWPQEIICENHMLRKRFTISIVPEYSCDEVPEEGAYLFWYEDPDEEIVYYIKQEYDEIGNPNGARIVVDGVKGYERRTYVQTGIIKWHPWNWPQPIITFDADLGEITVENVDGADTYTGSPWHTDEGDVLMGRHRWNENAAAFALISEPYSIDGLSVFYQSDAIEPIEYTQDGYFFNSIVIDGDLIVGGLPHENDSTGEIYVQRRVNGQWQGTKLFAYDSKPESYYGYSVAVRDNEIYVGSPQTNNSSDIGSVYRISDIGNTWHQEKFSAPDTLVGDQFGFSIAAEGNILVVGAPNKEVNWASNGAAYIFEFNDGNVDVTTLHSSDGTFFGRSVATDGNMVVVSAMLSTLSPVGIAQVFARDNGDWVKIADLITTQLSGETDRFGDSVAISGNRVVVGARDSSGGSGSIHIFEGTNSGGEWTWSSDTMIAGTVGEMGTVFGRYIAIHGNRIVVGDPAYTEATTNFMGRSYIYEIVNSNWYEQIISNEDYLESLFFGIGVDIDGDTIAIAEAMNGHIYLYQTGCPGACAKNSDCNDGDFCNGMEICSNGVCQSGIRPCEGEMCDENANRCYGCNTDADCDDGLYCNGNELCNANRCVAGSRPCAAPALCDEASDACVSCLFDADCDDGAFCNGAEICVSGSCQDNVDPCPPGQCNEDADICITCTVDADCDDGNVCTNDICDPELGCIYTNNTNSCNDGNACTSSDTCNAGTCVGTPITCDDGNVCTDNSCNPATGCVFTNNTASCNDANECTINDTCSAGSCSGTPRTCDDGNVCTDDSCNPASGCVFTNNTNPCNDGEVCTIGDVCSGGVCVPGSIDPCDDGNECTEDTCVLGGAGCQHSYRPAGYACGTDGSCDGAGNCVECVYDSDCDDGNDCDGVDYCDAFGACHDGDYPCGATQLCDPALGCLDCYDNDADTYGTGTQCSVQDCDDGDPNQYPGATEFCNGEDDDCDGIQDGSEGLTQQCGTTDVGSCTFGIEQCQDDGSWAYCNALFPTTETCNGADDDCDGVLDGSENLTQQCGTTDVGACTFGTETCQNNGTWAGCTAVFPATETCNGADDDCDTVLDGSENLTRQCGTTDVGACSFGTETCQNNGSWAGCTAVFPTTETCNGADDDCDGVLDGSENLTRQCGTTDVGACSFGTETCQNNGSWAGCTAVFPATETCNGVDDDCDGVLDGSENLTQQCGTTDVGECTFGSESCDNSGNWVNCSAVFPVTEVCDDTLDNDCDGYTDGADDDCCSETVLFFDNFAYDFSNQNSPWFENGSDADYSVANMRTSSGYPAGGSGNPVAQAVSCGGYFDSNYCRIQMDASVSLAGYTGARLSFQRYIATAFDSSDYLRVEISTDNGSSWTQIYNWYGGNGDDGVWHSESYTVSGAAQILVRIADRGSSSDEYTNIDDFTITGTCN
ncbi:MAG: hypothetical protein JXA30_21725 [Deltaproteobacteria bacterium]|nr:hypothetical protein [Deltaproteobacteria bacterium]